MVDYLTALGVTSIELLPIHTFVNDSQFGKHVAAVGGWITADPPPSERRPLQRTVNPPLWSACNQ
jgi:hypothetical protein